MNSLLSFPSYLFQHDEEQHCFKSTSSQQRAGVQQPSSRSSGTQTASSIHSILEVHTPQTFSLACKQPSAFLVDPDGRLWSAGGEQGAGWDPGKGLPPGFFSLSVVSLSEHSKLASNEADYAHALVQYCNASASGLGVVIHTLARLASLPCLPGSTQSMFVDSSVPWPRPTAFNRIGEQGKEEGQPVGLGTSARLLQQCGDSATVMEGDCTTQPSNSSPFIMLEHHMGTPGTGWGPSKGFHTIRGPPADMHPSMALQLVQPPQRQQSSGELPQACLRSMLVAAVAPCLLTLISQSVGKGFCSALFIYV